MTGDRDQVGAYASKLLAMLAEQAEADQAELHGGSDWPIELSAVLVALERGGDLRELAARKATPTRGNRIIGLAVEDEFSGGVRGIDGQLPSPWTGPAIALRRRKLWSTVRS